MTARLRARVRDDRGSVAVESILYVFIVVLAAVICVQGIFLTQSVSASQRLARDAARSYATGASALDVENQVRGALPSWARLERVTFPSSADAAVKVELRVPIVVPGVTTSSFTVSRDAVMPRS